MVDYRRPVLDIGEGTLVPDEIVKKHLPKIYVRLIRNVIIKNGSSFLYVLKLVEEFTTIFTLTCYSPYSLSDGETDEFRLSKSRGTDYSTVERKIISVKKIKDDVYFFLLYFR